jgi:hypothetical protein
MDMAGVFAMLIVLPKIDVVLHLIVRRLRQHLIFWVDVRGQNSKEISGP